MVSSRYTATLITIAVSFLVQPAPAPPLLLPVLLPVGSLGTLWCGIYVQDKIGKRDLAADCPIDPHFSTCISDLMDGGKVTVHVNEDHRVVASGLSPACITQVNEYNASPDIESLNAKHGTATVLNGTSIQLSGMSEDALEKIASMVKIVQ